MFRIGTERGRDGTGDMSGQGVVCYPTLCFVTPEIW